MADTEIIDNTFHPVDSGLEATNDHWGTQLPATNGNQMLEDSANRNQSRQFKDGVRATRAAARSGGYDSTGTYKGN